MKTISALACLGFFALSVAMVQPATASTVEDQIKNREQDWAHSIVKQGAAVVDQFEADDITSTDPSGRVTDRTQDEKDLSSGDL